MKNNIKTAIYALTTHFDHLDDEISIAINSESYGTALFKDLHRLSNNAYQIKIALKEMQEISNKYKD